MFFLSKLMYVFLPFCSLVSQKHIGNGGKHINWQKIFVHKCCLLSTGWIMYLRDAPIKYQRMGHRKTGSVHLVDQGERGRGQTNNRPPAGSEYWSVHWLSSDELKTDVRGATGEVSHAPGRGTRVMMFMMMVMMMMARHLYGSSQFINKRLQNVLQSSRS